MSEQDTEEHADRQGLGQVGSPGAAPVRLTGSVRRLLGLAISVLVLGLGVGLSSGLLSLFFAGSEKLMLGFVEGPHQAGAFQTPALRRFISVSLAGLVTAILWWLLRNRTRPVPSVKRAVRGADMPAWQTATHVLLQIFLVASGGSIGREVAPREAGAMLATYWTRLLGRLGLRKADRTMLVAAAAGAGFAGIYIAPLTGAFFGIEVLLGQVSITVVMVNLGMSALATLVGGVIKGFGTYYALPNQAFSPWMMGLCLLIGPLMGLVGTGFRRLTSWAEQHQSTGNPILFQLPVACILTGLVAIWMPQVMGNGRSMAQTAMNQTLQGITDAHALVMALGTLCLFALVKAVFTVATIRSGASGGTLTPSIAIGASLGAGVGLVGAWFLPAVPVWQCALIGATALLAASQQAPLMALAMLMEVSHLPITAIMPLGFAVALSILVSQVLLSLSQKAGHELAAAPCNHTVGGTG